VRYLLLPQGVVLLAGLIALTPLRRRWAALRRTRPTRATVVLAAGLLLALAGTCLASARLISDARDGWRLSESDRRIRGGQKLRLEVRFLEWARRRVPNDATFYLAFRGRRREAAYQWATYRLFPRVAVGSPAEAEWVVFYGVRRPPKASRSGPFRRVIPFRAGFALGERRR
jgi:hypothetical protein